MAQIFRRLGWMPIAALLLAGSLAGQGRGGLAQAQASTTVQVMTGSVGQYLADANGKTLYVFSADTANAGTSACNGACAGPWPPFVLSGDLMPPDGLMNTLGMIARQDGSSQVTYGGMPLYYFARDTAAGQIGGQGITAFGGTWTAATP